MLVVIMAVSGFPQSDPAEGDNLLSTVPTSLRYFTRTFHNQVTASAIF
jgi:hypothetical protein